MVENKKNEYSVEEIFNAIKEMLKNTHIPAVYLKSETAGFDGLDGNKFDRKLNYKIEEILEMVTTDNIQLPTVQRGFVWKSHQIENLWDSLLRGYPIGCLVLAPGKKGYDLLDGQQRATALCLGNYYPSKSVKSSDVLNSSYDRIRIFIDLAKPSSEDESRKYYIRVITKSHPWGYQKNENHKALESNKIRDALDAFKLEDDNYFNHSLDGMWPYDSKRPIPMGFFLHAAMNDLSLAELERVILDWELSNENFKKFLEKEPINLKNEILQDSESLISNTENLFIRMNSGGTPLTGEELNYSILKSNISEEAILKIEEGCGNFIRPARFISIAYRLFQNFNLKSTPTNHRREILSMNVKSRQFQSEIRGKLVDFEKFVEEIIVEKKLLQKAKKILCYDTSKKNDIGLPFVSATKIAESSAEVMFVLLYRLYVMGDQLKTEEVRKKVLGVVTLLSWFGKGGKQKNHAAVLRNIWPSVSKIEDEDRFWSRETIARAGIKDYERDVFVEVPFFKDLKKLIRDNPFKNKEEFSKKPHYEFISKAFYNRDVVLYAQRHFICTQFENIFESDVLNDFNLPFDWDHICPSERIDGQRKITKEVRDWYGSNGNMRAWPYGWNRADQNKTPKMKLAELKLDSDDLKRWEKRIQIHHKEVLKSGLKASLSDFLCEWSACNRSWKDFDFKTEDIKGRTNSAKYLYEIIMERNLDICRNWYESLSIDSLLIDKDKDYLNFLKFLDGRTWKDFDVTQEDKNYWDSSDKGIEMSVSEDNRITLIIAHANSKDQNSSFNLQEDGVYAALRIKKDNEKYSTSSAEGYYVDLESEKVLYITPDPAMILLSYSDESHYLFLKELKDWLENIPEVILKNYRINRKYLLERFKIKGEN